MKILLTFVTDDGALDEKITTVREFKADNPNEPAAWYIENEIRAHGKYEYTYGGGITLTLTKAPRGR